MPENPDDYIDGEEYEEDYESDSEEYGQDEEVDESRRRLLCGLGALAISLPFVALGVRESLIAGLSEEPKKEEAEENSPGKGKRKGKRKGKGKRRPPETKKPKKLGESIIKNNNLIIGFIDNPDSLKKWYPEEKQQKARQLVAIINAYKNQPWAKSGIEKLRRDITNGRFKLPMGPFDAYSAQRRYFPDMPMSAAANLIRVIF